MSPIHATCVSRHGPDGWRGVLLTGPSGAGKSDLALRLIGQGPGGGWRLIADDYSAVWRSGGAVWATAPTGIVGRIEARGLGILSCPPRLVTRIVLVVACGREPVERLPEPAHETVAGVRLARMTLDIRPASAVEKVAAMLKQV